MKVDIAGDVPVVMLVAALANEGFELVSTSKGLTIRLSARYLEDGKCCGNFVPGFLRYQPNDASSGPDAFSICPTV